METTTTQAAFLANGNNKKRLIQMLSQKMVDAGINVKQAEADADSLMSPLHYPWQNLKICQ